MNALHTLIFGRKYYAFESEYLAILDKANVLGYSLPTSEEMTIQNILVKGLKDAGIWAKLDELYVFVNSAGVNFSRINFINPNNILTQLSSPTDYIFTNKGGYTALAYPSVIHFDSSVNPSISMGNYKLNDASFGLSLGDNSSTNSGTSGIVSSNTVSVWFREVLKRLYFQQNGGNTTLSALTEPLINKTRLVSLKASNLKVFEDSVKKVDQAHIVSDIDVNYTFRFMRVVNGYVNYKMFFIGGGLTEIESLEFSSLWNDYLNTI